MTPYQIKITKKAAKDLKKVDIDIRPRVIEKIRKLASSPKPTQFKPLTNFKISDYRLRDQHEILIIRIGHRKDIYR